MLNDISIKGQVLQKGKKYSNIEIKSLVDKIAAYIVENKFVEKDDEIFVIALPRNIYLISTMLACIKLQIAFMLIDMNTPLERLEYMIKHSKVRKCFCMNENAIRNLGLYAINIENALEYASHQKLVKKSYNGKIAYIIWTSGTSGKPKAVCVKREGMFNFIEVMPKELGVREGTAIGCFTNAMFDIFFLETLMAIHVGMDIVMADEKEILNPRSLKEIIMDYDIAVLQMTPSKMRLLETVDEKFDCLKCVAKILVGGEEFPRDLLKKLQRYTNADIYNLYGPTEATIWATISNLTNKDFVDLGRPIENVEIYLFKDGKMVLENEHGEICIGGVGLADGYLYNLEQTKRAFQYVNELDKVVYHTGDLGKYDENGRLIYLGRIDTQVKYHGYRIELQDVEENIRDIEGIADVVVCFDKLDNQMIAFYKSVSEFGEEYMRENCRKKLPAYMCPSKFVRKNSFIYTVSGKVDRNKMLTIYKEMKIERESDGEMFVDIIEKCSKCRDVHLNMQVSDLGLDSMSYIAMLVELESQYGVEFEDEMLVMDSFNKIKDIYNFIFEND